MSEKKQIILYHTLGCHLCDQALALCAQTIHAEQLNLYIETVDIVHDDKLISRYGEQIPVLQRGDGETLSYPFAAKTLADWLKSA